jgi:LacI family transcriptional regulator
MKDVAARAGVSMTTVSHILNRKRGFSVSAKTRQRVLDAARELKYRPNVHARHLAQGQSSAVGLIISEISNPYFPDIIQGFEKAASERGLELLLCNTEYESARVEAAVHKMIDDKVRGVAVMTSMFDESYAKELVAHRIPVVHLSSSLNHPLLKRLQVDYSKGFSAALQHLLSLGHQSFGVISGPLNTNSAVSIRDALIDALARHGLQPSHILESQYKVDAGASAVETLRSKPPLPTALLCCNDLIALGAISALQEAGIRVPQDISVVGCDDLYFARLARPPLTTVHVPRQEMGRLAFQMLCAIRQRATRSDLKPSVETHVVIRKSTAASRGPVPISVEKGYPSGEPIYRG